MRISSICYDAAGYRLICIEHVMYCHGRKPHYSHWRFADYRDGILRIFFGDNFILYEFKDRRGNGDFKSACKFIFKDYCLISVQQTKIAFAEARRREKYQFVGKR